jgi:hypothetical protein
MRLGDLFKPRWRAADPAIRLHAIRALTANPKLAEIARTDESSKVAQAALEKIRDPSLVADLATSAKDPRTRGFAAARVTDQALLARIATTDASDFVRSQATRGIQAPEILAQIAGADKDVGVRVAAVERITDATVLSRLARAEQSPLVRMALIGNVGDLRTLAEIVGQDPSYLDALAALTPRTGKGKVVEKLLLIAETHPRVEVRRRAFEAVLFMPESERGGLPGALLVDLALRESEDKVIHRVIKELTIQLKPSSPDWLRIARDAASPLARLLALESVSDRSVLVSVAIADANPYAREAALRRIESVSGTEFAELREANPHQAGALLEKLAERAVLLELLWHDPDPEIGERALVPLRDEPALLAEIARRHRHPRVRLAALRRIVDPSESLLREIAASEADDAIRTEVERLFRDCERRRELAARGISPLTEDELASLKCGLLNAGDIASATTLLDRVLASFLAESPEEDIRKDFQESTVAWGSQTLATGDIGRIRELVLADWARSASGGGFSFGKQYGGIQINQYRQATRTFRAIRIWRTETQYFAYGGPGFGAE